MLIYLCFGGETGKIPKKSRKRFVGGKKFFYVCGMRELKPTLESIRSAGFGVVYERWSDDAVLYGEDYIVDSWSIRSMDEALHETSWYTILVIKLA